MNLKGSSASSGFGIRTNHHAAGLPVGIMKPIKGYISRDIEVREAPPDTGGGRGIFAKADLPFDREVMRVPAMTYYVGDDDVKAQVREVLGWVISRYVGNADGIRAYMERNVFTLMKGGFSHFSSEEEVRRVVSDIPGGVQLLTQDLLSTNDIARLAMRIQFNRFDLEYNGRKGIALFPEAALYNHSCEPNIELTFSFNDEKEYVCSARVLKPVKRGEQLLINYFPNHDLPISRFGAAMRKRWGFECGCSMCRSRITSASVFVIVFFVFPIIFPLRSIYMRRLSASARNAGFT